MTTGDVAEAPEVYVFDAYGTLFDVGSAVAREAAAIGPAAGQLAELWRAKQLEYSWVETLRGVHPDFWQLTSRSLDHALTVVHPGAAPAMRSRLLDAYLRLDPYPEVSHVLHALRDRGARLAILSNGTPDMLAQAVQAADLQGLFEAVLSVEEVGVYKPDARVYQLACDRLGVLPQAVSFQSSNAWDAAGAAAFGFRVVWVNRRGAPREYADAGKVVEIPDLASLLAM